MAQTLEYSIYHEVIVGRREQSQIDGRCPTPSTLYSVTERKNKNMPYFTVGGEGGELLLEDSIVKDIAAIPSLSSHTPPPRDLR